MLELTVYDNLYEVIDTILELYPFSLFSLNEFDKGEGHAQIPHIRINFTPIDNNVIIKINKEKYVFAGIGHSIFTNDYTIKGYMPQQWITRSPIIVYPIFFEGEYIELHLTLKEARMRLCEICEECNEV